MEHFTPPTHTLSHVDIPFKNLIWTRLGVSVTRNVFSDSCACKLPVNVMPDSPVPVKEEQSC